jgi:RND superfamily putative drug exporter
MLLMGRRTWWLPRRLDRVLPHISVEGEPRPQNA